MEKGRKTTFSRKFRGVVPVPNRVVCSVLDQCLYFGHNLLISYPI